LFIICRDELIKNAAYIDTPGKGIIVADESTGTISKCTSMSRMWRITIVSYMSSFSAPLELSSISVVSFFLRRLYRKTKDKKPFVDVLEGGVLHGIRVDEGTINVAITNGKINKQV
jgi:fructose-bisphosphate aldolase class 1